jgi:hypothetical protein
MSDGFVWSSLSIRWSRDDHGESVLGDLLWLGLNVSYNNYALVDCMKMSRWWGIHILHICVHIFL